MDPDTAAEVPGGTWARTREAVARFRQLLLCSKWSCAGPHAGDGCSVCRSPAWVKDIHINRQLNNIADLFRNLEALLQPAEAAGGDPAQTASPSPALPQKKVKIWFSPRSRKVRCRVEKPARVSGRNVAEPPPGPPASELLSVFNFTSSSQDSGSSPTRKAKEVERKKKRKRGGASVGKPASAGAEPRTRRQNAVKKRQVRLEVVNQQWGFGSGAAVEVQAEEQERGTRPGDVEGRPTKKVSFQYPESQPEEAPRDDLPQGGAQILSPRRSILKEGTAKEAQQSNEEPNVLVPPPEQLPALLPEPDPALDCRVPAQLSPCRSVKRARLEEVGGSPRSTPKRPGPSVARGRRRSTLGKIAAPSTPPPDSSRLSEVPGRSTEERQKGISGSSQVDTKRSPATPAKGRGGPRHGSGSPAYVKRNQRGETPLHLAAIKGDVALTTQLLTQGADPNLKDHAGWTPLHEACNLGHLGVVEVLLQQGVLLNTPGYENHSPLHDAVRNGHVDVARRLLEHGASASVLNIFGLQPIDYAETEEMREVLRTARSPISTPLSSPASLSKSPGILRKDAQVTLIGTKLTQSQQNQLNKAAQLLGGRRLQTFSSAVTHVVVPEDGVPSTLTVLQGILGGCWVVRFSWLARSLQHGAWEDEEAFEAGEGPRRARANRHSLLPQLFDGCFFYLLGTFRKPPKDELLQLVKTGGGRPLTRQPKPDSDVTQTVSAAAYHAQPGSDQALCTQYILYDPQGTYRPGRVRLGKVWSAPSSWLLECILAFSLLPVPEI
ncbi:BRCA1-associated RING domain protein 1 isoform X2 [Brachyhypopomus gauderio]|uniref:BRCA1-associated RING domain protein 1 isoform X2 n=1 Tax=Brachyhypopomus gauderio TaxID=698409 RepID=UPI0040417833